MIKNRVDLISSLNQLLGRLGGGGACSITVGNISQGLMDGSIIETAINSQIDTFQKDIDKILSSADFTNYNP